MASTAAMSDEEIRRKLKEYNINIPLTDTTRKILVEKIAKLSENKKTPSPSRNSKPTRRTISHFSSGEDETESEDDSRSKKKTKMPPPSTSQRSTRRQTIGAVAAKPPPVLPSEPSRRSTAFRSPVSSPPLRVDVKKPTSRFSVAAQSSPTFISPNVTMRQPRSKNADDYDKGSDSDSPAVRTLPRLADMKTSVDNVVDDLISSSNFLNRLSKVSAYMKGEGDDKIDASSRDVLMSYRKPAMSEDEDPSPFVSDFTRSISRRQPSHIFSSSKSYQTDASLNDDSFNASAGRSSINGSFSSGRDMSRTFTATESEAGLWSNTHRVSWVLVIFAVVFFVALGVFYYNMHGNEVVNYDAANTRNKIPFCSSATDPQAPCVTTVQVNAATSLLALVKPELERRAIASVCGPALRDGTYVKALMTEKDLVDWLFDLHDINGDTARKDLRNLRLLLRLNAHWGVSVVGAMPPATRVSRDVDEEQLLIDGGGLMIGSVTLPLACHIKQKLTAVLTAVLLIVSVAGLSYGGRRGYSWWTARRERRRQRLYTLVQRIVSAVQTASEHGTQYVAIDHVCDQLIEPKDREGMRGEWKNAVECIELNESRIRREVQCVSGEECSVWRWLPGCGASPGAAEDQDGGARNKQWHGQAFGTEPGAQNGAPNAPTPCLKLRHMFDDTEYGDEWVRKVQDALLHKVGERARIIHLHVDRASTEGCVYMKLASKEEAGVAYGALHGWWFDSHLVTVKYLRLERYHERFPDAVNAKVSLKPSMDETDE